MGSLSLSSFVRKRIKSAIFVASSALYRSTTTLILPFIVACAPNATPNLLEIHSLGPSTLESGSDLQIRGSGFPENRAGKLSFTGTAYIPARRPRKIEWELPLRANSHGEILIRLTSRELAEQLQGAHHATFRGDALLSFAPTIEGRPVLKGAKTDLVLDLFSSEVSTKDITPFLQFIGLELGEGLLITKLRPGGLASKAGLATGDLLLTLDNVRLDTPQDLLPQAAARTSAIEYSRGGHRGKGLAFIDRGSFQVLDPGVAARAVAVVGGLAIALLWAARPPRFLLWLFGEKSKVRRLRAVWLTGVKPGRQLLAYPIFLCIVLAYWFLTSGLEAPIWGAEFLLCLSAGGLLLLTSSFLLGGTRSSGRSFSLTGALSSTLLRLLVLIPILAAALSRAFETGSLRLLEIAKEQGPWPQEWGIFASPWSFVLGLSFLVALLPLSGRRAPLEGHPGSSGNTLVWARSWEWAGHLLLIGLWVVIFGGSNLGAPHLSFFAGALLSAKLAALAHLLSWIRARSGQLRLGESGSLFGWANLLTALLAGSLSFVSTVSGFSESHAELLGLFALTLAGGSALLLFISSQRSWAHMGRRIDPWI